MSFIRGVSIPRAVGVVATRIGLINSCPYPEVSIPRAVGVVATVMETSHKSHKNATFQYRER